MSMHPTITAALAEERRRDLTARAAAYRLALGTAAPAFAAGLRPPPGSLHSPPAPPATTTHTVVVGGMPGWQITLIAVSAAVLAATLALILDRARTARRQLAAQSV